jgi:TM2 domain-containing membrane protein YozV
MIIRSCLTCISLCAIFLTEAQTGTDSLRRGAYADSLRRQASAGACADSLYRAGRYFEASIAWERVLFENKDPQQQVVAIMGKTQCLKQEGLFDPAVSFLESWQAFPFPDSDRVRIHYEVILCTYLGGHFESVLSLVDRWSYEHGGASPTPLLVVLKILSLNELQRWKEAGDTYRSFIGEQLRIPHHPGSYDREPPPDLYAQIPRLKSVSRAEALSTFIPGAGQFYAGKPGEAIFSILVQAAGIYFAVLSFEQHYYVSAWLVGAALFGAFHMGGVRRSEVLVQRYNRKKMIAFNEKVRTQLLSLISAGRAAP